MKYLLLPCLLLLMLCACSSEDALSPSAAPSTAETTLPETTAPTAAETHPETLPPHSPLYIPGLDVEDVCRYFREVTLDGEYIHSGNASLVQKWMVPIYIHVWGTPTDEDLSTLRSFLEELNRMEGFPGIFLTEDPGQTNLNLYFCNQQELTERMGDGFSHLDGAVTFWYEGNAIYEEIICIRTDLGQDVRNSVILEELYNGLGPVQDTLLRSDSIIWQEYSTPQNLTEVDWLILKLLYHPDIRCGMNSEECDAVIRQLYY